MTTKEYLFKNIDTLNIKECYKITKISNKYKNNKIKIKKHSREVKANSLFGLLSLAIMKNDLIKITVYGENSNIILDEIIEYFNSL